MKRLVTLAVLVGLSSCTSMDPNPATVTLDSAMTPASASASAERRGFRYAEANCAACHAVGVTGQSALPAAPHFRALGQRYPVETLAEAFAEGIDTAHPDMPEFVLSTEENANLIAYLKSIQVHSTR